MEVSARNITNRIKELVIEPKDFWIAQKQAGDNQSQLLLGYFFPLLLLVSLAVFFGEYFGSNHFYIGFALLKALREIMLFTLQYFISLFLTNELIKTFGGQKNLSVTQKLVIYSLTPFLLVSLVSGLFPFLYIIDILGLYGFYIFYTGVKELLVFPGQKQNSYILITVLVNFFVFSFLSIFLSKLLTAYL